jgi:Tfp pilus assembly protein PilX
VSGNRANRRAGYVQHRRGAGLVIALVTLLVVTSTMAAIIQALLVDLRQTRQTANELQAQWLADSSVSRAVAQCKASTSYTGETWRAPVASEAKPEECGVAEIRIEQSDEPEKGLRVIVEARYPDHPTRRVVARRTLLISPANQNSNANNNSQESAP